MNAQNLYEITIKTPKLELRLPNSSDAEELAQVLTNGIQKENEPHFMEENLYGKSVEDNTKWLREFIGKSIKEWNKEDWHIPFAVFYKGKVIGLVTMFSHNFPITQGYGISYWIGLQYQGHGLGTEAFQALLFFGFVGLGAQEAYAGAYSDNIPSLHLMEKLGFVFNGEYWMARQGKAIKDRRMRLPKENWIKPTNINIGGLEQLSEKINEYFH